MSEVQFGRLVALVRRRCGDVQRGRPWWLPLEDRVLLVATYWRTNLTLRQVAPLLGISKSAADRVLDHLAPLLAISPARRPRKDTVLIVDGTLVPTRDRTIAASGRNYRYSTNLQVVIDANSRLVVAVGIPLPGTRNDCRAFTESGVDRACRGAPVLADGGYQGTATLMPHRKPRGHKQLSRQQEAENAVHRRARAHVEHAFSRLKNWKILRDCSLRGAGVHQAMLGIARLHNLALTR
ncbi:transposase [Streptomyces sp. QH1-20]|uniref:transposase n=1 Tax=Streptomyces sp. QH1-20 TaxID=3240934 RepID=UPI003517FF49